MYSYILWIKWLKLNSRTSRERNREQKAKIKNKKAQRGIREYNQNLAMPLASADWLTSERVLQESDERAQVWGSQKA